MIEMSVRHEAGEVEGRPVRCCEGCEEPAGSVSAGTGKPLVRDRSGATGGFFHVGCRPGYVGGAAAAIRLARLERMGG